MSAIGDRSGTPPPPQTLLDSASVQPVSDSPEPPARVRRRRHRSLLPLFLLAPAVLLFLLFTVAPGGYAIYLSFMRMKVGGGLLGDQNPTQVFAGLQNYHAAFADSEFWHSILRMLFVAVIGVPATIVFSTLFALCLDAKRARLVGFARLAIFLPYAVPGVVATLLWGFIYLPATSPIGGATFDYFGSRSVFFSVANVAVWGVLGFNMVVVYTSLRGLPRELFEAAEIDGASELQIALRVKLPLLAPTLTLVTVFSLIGALQLFNEPNTLKPITNAISSTWVPLMRVYTDAFVTNDIYKGAAASFLLIVLTVTATVLANAVLRRISRRSER
ncbi:MAG TPA: sugar ABC transporter permease [Actinocrinis sp.]|uniref:carbohydrate ABC transporter permease n=1 Tax=Actinocrinis sp. TaxID=1920516 RepID=UPI002DDD4568|nr:sugar ABC transporter permease [Actinocrinis sp.]HEV3172520.1 sugar ABC transporter permease [Actinocrinis sp.]